MADEDWRDFYVFGLTPDGAQVLYHDPSFGGTAAWLEDVSGGTNVPTRGLMPAGGAEADTEGHLYRFLAAREDPRGEVEEALLVDMIVYWPDCLPRETVDGWKALAETPRQSESPPQPPRPSGRR